MTWRPKGWWNVFNYMTTPNGVFDVLIDPKTNEKITTEDRMMMFKIYEMGADAMLEVLRKHGEHLTKKEAMILLDPKAHTCYPFPCSGTYVFIPDEEVF